MSLEGKGPNVFQPVKIAPSILSADFMNLQRDIAAIEAGGAGYVHVDVMDGHFVPNLTMGVPVVKQLKKITDMPLDVHLMISNPLEQLPWFLAAGADIVTADTGNKGNISPGSAGSHRLIRTFTTISDVITTTYQRFTRLRKSGN